MPLLLVILIVIFGGIRGAGLGLRAKVRPIAPRGFGQIGFLPWEPLLASSYVRPLSENFPRPPDV